MSMKQVNRIADKKNIVSSKWEMTSRCKAGSDVLQKKILT